MSVALVVEITFEVRCGEVVCGTSHAECCGGMNGLALFAGSEGGEVLFIVTRSNLFES